MSDAEIDRKLAELEELVKEVLTGGWSLRAMKSAMQQLPKIIALSLELTRAVIARLRALEASR